jgi:hypothetical protein
MVLFPRKDTELIRVQFSHGGAECIDKRKQVIRNSDQERFLVSITPVFKHRSCLLDIF